MDDYLHPVAADHDFVDLSTMNTPHPAVPDHPSYVPPSEDLTHHVDASGSKVSTLQEVVEPLAVPIISGKELRKSSGASLLVDEPDGSTEENVDVLAETSHYSLVDEDDQYDVDEEYQEETSHHNKTARNAKTAVQNGKMGRRLNKVLLETPEEEIDPRKLPIKDLILLGELKEQRLKKGAATKQNSLLNRSGTNPFAEDAPYDKDDTFLSEDNGMNPDDDDDEATPYASSSKYNYHSFMEPHKKRKKRWSKEDTERFYEVKLLFIPCNHMKCCLLKVLRQKLRRLEVAVMEYRESLEDRGMESLEEIERKVAYQRRRLQSEFGFSDPNEDVSGR
ncbi:hypothetical protein IFM89_031978, partial [Coptis chinensis]